MTGLTRLSLRRTIPPNLELARERLGPLGVEVIEVSLTKDDPLPFEDDAFDLVLNRHSGMNHAEVGRILALGGAFLTQQVHRLWAWDLLVVFGVEPQLPNATPEYHMARLEAAGLIIDCVEEWTGDLVFTDVGAIVYYLRAVPWLVPGFSVDTHFDHLLHLQRQMEERGRLTFEARLYLIEARKPRQTIQQT